MDNEWELNILIDYRGMRGDGADDAQGTESAPLLTDGSVLTNEWGRTEVGGADWELGGACWEGGGGADPEPGTLSCAVVECACCTGKDPVPAPA